MKKLIICLFVFVLMFQLVDAAEIFNDEVADNVPFKITDITHVARYYPSAKKVSLMAGTDRILVAIADCEDLNNLKYCFDSATEGVNEETGDPASTMELRVMQSGPDISIDREVTNDEPGLGEEVEITATLTNNGNERATNVVYEDNFPGSVKISSTYYNVINNGVSWGGSIETGKSVTVKYKVKFQEFITYDSVAEVSWIFNNKVNKAKSDSLKFEVKKPYEISEVISAKSVDLGEEIIYTLFVNNSDSLNPLSISSIEILLPKGVTVSNRDMDLTPGTDKLTFKGDLPAGDEKSLSFRVKSLKSVQGKITVNAALRTGGKDFTEKFEHSIGIGVSDIMPEITFEPTTVKGGSELQIEAKITNNGAAAVSGISLDMASDIVEIRGWRDLSLDPGKKHYAFNKIISAPSIDVEKNYFIKLSGSYRTASGKTMKFEATQEVIVTPQERVIELTPEAVVDGKEVNITLKVKNIAPYKLTYVSLIDSFPSGFKSSAGERYVDIDELGIGEERTAYSYIVKAPDAYTKKSFEITHTFNALDKDEKKVMFEKKTSVELGEGAAAGAEETGSAGIDASMNASTDANATQVTAPEDAEKPGVFKRMWSWIKGLFGGKDEADESFE